MSERALKTWLTETFPFIGTTSICMSCIFLLSTYLDTSSLCFSLTGMSTSKVKPNFTMNVVSKHEGELVREDIAGAEGKENGRAFSSERRQAVGAFYSPYHAYELVVLVVLNLVH